MELNKCQICGKTFKGYVGLSKHLPQMHPDVTFQEYYDKYLRQPGEGVCPVCGKPTKFSGRLNRGYYSHCSKKCTANDNGTVAKRKATSLELYGSEGYNNHEQTSKTKLERYGDANYANGDRIRATKKERYGIAGYNNPEKRKLTKLEKYGASNYVNTEKAMATKEARYGDPTYNNSMKMQSTKLERYGISNFVNPEKARDTVLKHTIEKYSEKLKGQCDILEYSNYRFKCRCIKCGHEFDIPINTGYMRLFRYGTKWCTNCNPPDATKSKSETALFQYVESLVGTGNVFQSDRKVLDGAELDIYVPEKKIAIEFDGLYWHNELNHPGTYHLRKTEMCERAGIRLIHIFEDEWMFQQDIVKSRIAGILNKNLRVYARDCTVEEVDSKTAAEFLNSNHIQGSCVSKWRYGLFDSTFGLVALMTFGKNRFDAGIELLRFCTLKHLSVVGGASRLFKHFTDDHPEIDSIISYADRRWSGPDAFYPKLGFELEGTTRPSYYYIIGNNRHNRMEFTKKALVESGYSESMSEHEIMLSRKIYRIYDCGNYRYKWTRT